MSILRFSAKSARILFLNPLPCIHKSLNPWRNFIVFPFTRIIGPVPGKIALSRCGIITRWRPSSEHKPAALNADPFGFPGYSSKLYLTGILYLFFSIWEVKLTFTVSNPDSQASNPPLFLTLPNYFPEYQHLKMLIRIYRIRYVTF